METKVLGLEDMSANEITAINGGAVACIPWVLFEVLQALSELAMGICAGMLLYDHLHEEEVEEYYLGELEAAVCIG